MMQKERKQQQRRKAGGHQRGSPATLPPAEESYGKSRGDREIFVAHGRCHGRAHEHPPRDLPAPQTVNKAPGTNARQQHLQRMLHAHKGEPKQVADEDQAHDGDPAPPTFRIRRFGGRRPGPAGHRRSDQNGSRHPGQ